MKIIDTHAHYDDSAFDEDRDKLISDMLENSVEAIINIGCSLKSSKAGIELSEKYGRIFCAVGIHPDDAKNVPENYIELLREMTKHKKVVAIGEIGLDYHYEGYDEAVQKKVFREQLMLAKELSLPAVIHSRDATADTMEILKEVNYDKVDIHCFSGSSETAVEYVKMGYYIGFTGVLTFKNAKKAVASCDAIPKDRLFLETDCPYMAPMPYRGERCNSSMLINTVEKLAEIKGLRIEEAIKQCNENAIRFFDLKF